MKELEIWKTLVNRSEGNEDKELLFDNNQLKRIQKYRQSAQY